MKIKRLDRNFELLDRPIAHRGIYGKSRNGELEIVENSLESIKLAIKYNIPFEFDIHQTKDDIPIVYHDLYIEKDGEKYWIRKHTLEEIRELTKDTVYVPTLEEIIELNSETKVPMVLDFKETNTILLNKYRRNVINILKDYDGEYAIESFNPAFILRMGAALPNALRGQLLCRGKTLIDNLNFKKSNIGKAYELIQSLICFISRADFIGLEINPSENWNYKIEKKLYNKVDKIQNVVIEFTSNATKKPIIGWTYNRFSDRFIAPHLYTNYFFDTRYGILEDYAEVYRSIPK